MLMLPAGGGAEKSKKGSRIFFEWTLCNINILVEDGSCLVSH